MQKYYVYAIKSKVDKRLYVGMSANPEKRLIEHNSGQTKSTKRFKPWEMVYVRMVGTRPEARKEEKRLKSGYGKEFLKNLLRP